MEQQKCQLSLKVHRKRQESTIVLELNNLFVLIYNSNLIYLYNKLFGNLSIYDFRWLNLNLSRQSASNLFEISAFKGNFSNCSKYLAFLPCW